MDILTMMWCPSCRDYVDADRLSRACLSCGEVTEVLSPQDLRKLRLEVFGTEKPEYWGMATGFKQNSPRGRPKKIKFGSCMKKLR